MLPQVYDFRHDDSGPDPFVVLPVLFFFLFLICLTFPESDPMNFWSVATPEDVRSGKYEIKTGRGNRGEVAYYKKPLRRSQEQF